MLRWTVTVVAFLAAFASRSAFAADAPKLDPAQVEFFEKQVRPVLVAQCIKCHGPEKQKGGLRLDTRAAMVLGGDSGTSMVVGKPDESLLIKAIRYNDAVQMPPNKKLGDKDIAALTAWVKMGAPWPVENVVRLEGGKEFKITDKDRAFWAFQPVRNPPLPAVKNAGWTKSPLDRFILAKLEESNLQPVAVADRRTLVRRATFDLIGLPPTPEEINAALNDQSDDWFAKVIDRLLASPHYGERWGRHWLDVARYGEDQAHTFQAKLYPSGFRYRDWVVKSLNDDMPYDRFLTEQIAGDLIEGGNREDRLAALGYFALGPVYYGNAKADELDDRIDTLCRGMLGLTVACARCHDHKFDPIPTKDYYSLAGVFQSTQFKEYPIADAPLMAEFERGQMEITAKADEITVFLKGQSARLSESMTAETARYMVAAWKLTNQRKVNKTLTVSDYAKREKLRDFVLERWVGYLFPKEAIARPHLETFHKVVAGQDTLTDLSADKNALAETEMAALEFQDRIRLLRARPEEALYKEIVGGLFAIPRDQVEKNLPADAMVKLKADRAVVELLKKKLPKIPTIHSLAEGVPANMRVSLRGNPATLGDEAPRRFLEILTGDDRPLYTQGSGRLQLARAIASKDNPLTARVIVNRVWAYHFGKGIVGTPSNFGNLGERPTHPELLDYLATRFVNNGWSLKTLHREIMLSATYQLGSGNHAANAQTDAANKFLWRMDRRRLEVEPWRDAMLAVSGNLDRAVGGASLDLASPDNRRRTFYAAISRHNLDGLLRLFDFPDPNIHSDRRPVTTVPLQQLFVLNSEFMVRQSKALAARLNENKDEDDAARVRRAFLIVYGRTPRDAEVQLGLEFLKAAASEPGEKPKPKTLTAWEQYAQVLLSANEFMHVD
ncbi:MAG: PSD1 and planctomycete cytochrome C domain-containing protein [Gemmataceae bacterium]|nr:PSD1 and planctomycete cytochrome C domain-containing protein [Gemmataceae bacterium]